MSLNSVAKIQATCSTLQGKQKWSCKHMFATTTASLAGHCNMKREKQKFTNSVVVGFEVLTEVVMKCSLIGYNSV
jgi:hypothetical protein